MLLSVVSISLMLTLLLSFICFLNLRKKKTKARNIISKIISLVPFIFGSIYVLIGSIIIFIYSTFQILIIVSSIEELMDIMGIGSIILIIGSIYTIYIILRDGKVKL